MIRGYLIVFPMQKVLKDFLFVTRRKPDLQELNEDKVIQ